MIEVITESDNKEMDCYYDIMNLLDSVALSGKDLTDEQKAKLDKLQSECNFAIEDIADANDCGPYDCKTWDDLVVALRKLFKSGDRI